MGASGAIVQGWGDPEPQTLRLLQVSPAGSWKASPACFLLSKQRLWESSLSSVPVSRASVHWQGDCRPTCPLDSGHPEADSLCHPGRSLRSEAGDEGWRASAAAAASQLQAAVG